MHSELAEVFSGMGKIYDNVSQSNVLDINFAQSQDIFFFCDPKSSTVSLFAEYPVVPRIIWYSRSF